MGSIFFEITIIVCVASFLAIVFRFFKQPTILAYILAGIIIGPFGKLQLNSQEEIRTMAQIGIALLLFMLGLEFKLKDLRSVGPMATLIGFTQIILTFAAGYFTSSMLGFSLISSLYIGIALSFSSTIIVVKLLSDKKELSSLYGKITVGLLLIQDFFAVFILILLSVFGANNQSVPTFNNVWLVAIKGISLFALTIILSRKVFPRLIRPIARSQETLFLFSLSWVFGFSALISSSFIGFPIEIGGFLAGLALADSSENFQIIARVRALRDFFITIFFVVLGMQMRFETSASTWWAIIILVTFVLLLKPLIVMIIMGLVGYRRRTTFLTGIHLGQISEFSLIIIFLGNKIGHVTNEVVSILTMVGVISFAMSTYLIHHGKKLSKILSPYLKFFERRTGVKEEQGSSDKELESLKNHVVLVGAHRMGQSILEALREEGEKVVVVDYDPDIARELKKEEILNLFGDIVYTDIQEKARLSKARLVISTISDGDDNLLLIESLKHAKTDVKIIVLAQDVEESRVLYKAGADYVILPNLMGGRYVAKLIKDDKLDKIDTFAKKDFVYLQ